MKSLIVGKNNPETAGPIGGAFRIPFRNDSGESIPPFAVMYPGEPENLDGRFCFPVTKPSTSFARRYLVNGPYAVPANGFGGGSWADTPVPVMRESSSLAYGVGWGVQVDSWKLERYAAGNFCALTDSKSGTGLFVQDWCNNLIVKLDGSLSAGGSQNANIMVGGPPVATETTIAIALYDKEMTTGKTLADNTVCGAVWVAGAWYKDWYGACPT